MNLLMLVPSLGRPDSSRAFYESFMETRGDGETDLRFLVDSNDPTLPRYRELIPDPYVESVEPGNVVEKMNRAALGVEHRYIGFIGDDNRFQTKAWDRTLTHVLDEMGGGFAYGNDGNWPNGEIPTHIVISSAIVQALGWMMLPTCRHLFVDNAWKVIGTEIGRIRYLPEVQVDHLHPLFGKGEWDSSYRRTNHPWMYAHDRAAFETWLEGPATADIDRAKSAVGILEEITHGSR